MAAVSAMHKQVEERTCQHKQEKSGSQYVGAMFRKQQESADHQQDQEREAAPRCQEATFRARLAAGVIVMRHAILYLIEQPGFFDGWRILMRLATETKMA
jgi:hypothetical protein